MDTGETAVSVVAIYAAIVATAELAWNVARNWQYVIVSVNQVDIRDASDRGLLGHTFAVLVVNRARDGLKIEEIGFILSDGSKLACYNSDLPKTVLPNANCKYPMDADVVLRLRSHANSIRWVYAQDAVMRTYKSKLSRKQRGFIVAEYETSPRML